MRFEYNSNLEFGERVKLVAKEIVDEYPLIGFDEATYAAVHAVPIDDKCTNDDKFDRYYFIMRAIGKNHDEFAHVFNDSYNLYREGFQKDIYNKVMVEIIDYVSSNSNFFPELSD